MQSSPPVNITGVVNLSDLGINSKDFRFGVLTMESDKYVAVKDQAPDGSVQVITVDMHDNNKVTRRPMKAEAVVMNPVDNIIALKGRVEGNTGHFLQVFNLGTKEKLGSYQFSNEHIVFWRWIAPRCLALVGDRSVYHWTFDSANSAPVKVFDRAGKLAENTTQIIAYATNSSQTWCVLSGISTPDGGRTIEGSLQLFSVERKQQQLLEGHAANFADAPVDDSGEAIGLFSFMERKAGSTATKLHIMDLARKTHYKVGVDVPMPAENPSDFAVSLHISPKHGMVYVLTKGGYAFVFDIGSGALLFRNKVSQDSIFIATYSDETGGVRFVNRGGHVINFGINVDSIVQYITDSMPQLSNRQDVAFNLARRYGLPGAQEMFQQQFTRYFAAGDYKQAARIAAQDASGSLRSPATIQQFKNAPSMPGQSTPLLQYFSALLESGHKLNESESMELVGPVVAQGRREFIEKWLSEDKLTCTEQLGDMVKPLDSKLALSVYLRAQCHDKVIACFVAAGEYDKVVQYVKRVNYANADYGGMLRTIVATNPEGAVKFAKDLLDNNPPLIDINKVVDSFMSLGKLQETTSVLLDYLKDDKPEQGQLQTRLLEMNLMQAPQVAEAIFQMNMLSHYDRQHIAMMCEKAGMYQRALEHYTDISDIRRCMLHSHDMSSDFLTNYIGKVLGNGTENSKSVALELIEDMLRYNRQQNIQVVVQVAIKYHDQLEVDKLVEIFEKYQCWEGMFFFLGGILSTSQDPDVHFKYIEAAAKLGHMQEVERVVRESQYYDPVKVKDFLKEAKLQDPRPLIYVCDMHGYVEELTDYLYSNNLMKYIEVYVTKVNPLNCPTVVGTLIDRDCSEDYIKNNILGNVSSGSAGFARALRLLQPWLEARLAEGNQEPSLHNALAKIYIDSNKDPENFLKTDSYYDSAVVGAYCEDRDPHLAYIAYKRAWGTCDDQLLRVTNNNGLFRLQARYLVERQSPELWAKALADDNQYRRHVIDQVVSTALPESKNADEVTAAVKAFIDADLPNELIELLEKIVLHNSDFSDNRTLQNLLILTAIKADKSRVMDYVHRLDNYDGPEIALIAMGDPYNLYEEAFEIYKKCGMNAEAMDTLLTNLDDDEGSGLERAKDFASRVNEPQVWYKLGAAQLRHGVCAMIPEAIDSYIKAGDATDYMEVIAVAEREECYDDLIKYLRMARTKQKDSYIDSELLYSLAKCDDRMDELEDFLDATNTANVQSVGDRLYEERLYKAAKVLFQSIPNNAKLASCYVNLGDFSAAIEAAKKAKNPRTWKEICFACVAAGDFRSAQTAGLHIIIHPDHLEEVIEVYENAGRYDELMALLELGITNSDEAHYGMFTELGILYAKHKKGKLMDFVKSNTSRLNIPKLIRACEANFLWQEAVYLYVSYDEYDSAANTIIQHSPTAWSQDLFQSVMSKVSNSEIYYRAINFYLDEHPLLLSDLLVAIQAKLDHARVIQHVRKAGHLPLIQDYIAAVQPNANIPQVNEALNELLVEEEDVDGLRSSIEHYDNFDQIALAQKLEHHHLIQMRRIAATLYNKNGRFKQSIELSKKDGMFTDAMESARESGSRDLAEGLLRYFATSEDVPCGRECFSACLYTCYELLRPDVVMELAWKKGYMDFAMPYMIQLMRDYSTGSSRSRRSGTESLAEDKEKSAPNDFVESKSHRSRWPRWSSCLDGPRWRYAVIVSSTRRCKSREPSVLHLARWGPWE
ncbi:hypothetical protein FOZ60_003512 [Perkinsus olseni]|uniref:Clathrin heavy chain n=1 Tax=Perkinsus olseni TaxID=32597 RepID=A0A7J6NW19_PEROL|nr:hypothetical protein FOZ60_003512 [Perkinsus olseni]